MEYITHSKEETVALGRRLGAKLKNHDIIFYTGDWAWAKPPLSQGICDRTWHTRPGLQALHLP